MYFETVGQSLKTDFSGVSAFGGHRCNPLSVCIDRVNGGRVDAGLRVLEGNREDFFVDHFAGDGRRGVIDRADGGILRLDHSVRKFGADLEGAVVLDHGVVFALRHLLHGDFLVVKLCGEAFQREKGPFQGDSDIFCLIIAVVGDFHGEIRLRCHIVEDRRVDEYEGYDIPPDASDSVPEVPAGVPAAGACAVLIFKL